MKKMSDDKVSYGNKGDNNQSKPFYPSLKPIKNLVVPESRNTPRQPKAIQEDFIKVPVVLGETTVQIDMDACIHFPKPVLD